MTNHLFRRPKTGLSSVIHHLPFSNHHLSFSNKYLSFSVALLSLLSCSSGDEPSATTPSTEVKPLEQGTDQRPLWQSPNYDAYEMTMSVEIHLQDTLQAYASTNDLLCATVGDEVRGIALPRQVGDEWLFPLTVGSNEGNIALTLSYYCERLHRIFTTPWTKIDASAMPIGEGGIYEPKFLQ